MLRGQGWAAAPALAQGTQQRWCPCSAELTTSTQPPRFFPAGGEIKPRRYFQVPRKESGPHHAPGVQPPGVPRESHCPLSPPQASSARADGDVVSPVVSPCSRPREAQETSAILPVHVWQQNQTHGCPSRQPRLCLRGEEEPPHHCQTLTPPLSHGHPKESYDMVTHPTPSGSGNDGELNHCSGDNTPATSPLLPGCQPSLAEEPSGGAHRTWQRLRAALSSCPSCLQHCLQLHLLPLVPWQQGELRGPL